ncbi:MAG: EAL domain-containing protein [Betaproteobacteria bacterium]|nr:MAG: EAL domain-containing protein [Betaproteobacteria bacterium]
MRAIMTSQAVDSAPTKAAKILVVDDTPINTEILADLLVPLGHEVTLAHSGESALALADTLRPDLILLDVMMPGMNGFEVCRRLKATPALSAIPVIFVTARGDDASAGFSAGGVDYIAKPVRLPELLARVNAHLRISGLLRELERNNASLSDARDELERRVAERTQELRLANAKLTQEIGERRQAEDQLNFLARHDYLTRLLNRTAFEEALSVLLSRLSPGGVEHTLLYLDLDQFKLVNDTAGHMAGDELLRQIGDLLRRTLAPQDIVARLGGDDFAALVHGTDADEGREAAERLRCAIADYRFTWRGQIYAVRVSIGLVEVTSEAASVERLLSLADTACYAAKEQGRDQVQVYDESHTQLQSRQAQMQLAPRITQALENDRFVLFRQDIRALHAADTGEHYEVLIRMSDGRGQITPPGQFLPSAERFGLMSQIDRWVVRRLFRGYAEHPEHLLRLSCCSINLSGLTIGDPSFESFLEAALKEFAIPGERLCFEITETAAITDLPRTLRFMHRFKRLGCRFALDDFGSGVSSYAYLKSLPVDFVKIDGTFVKDMADDAIDRAMVKSINEVAHVMGHKTIAEYAESDAILALLKDQGIDYAQGYAIDRPRMLV